MQRVWDIIAIAAPVSVSPPYAAGKMTVFRPMGVEYAKKQRVIVSISALRSIKIPTNKTGKIISLRAVII